MFPLLLNSSTPAETPVPLEAQCDSQAGVLASLPVTRCATAVVAAQSACDAVLEAYFVLDTASCVAVSSLDASLSIVICAASSVSVTGSDMGTASVTRYCVSTTDVDTALTASLAFEVSLDEATCDAVSSLNGTMSNSIGVAGVVVSSSDLSTSGLAVLRYSRGVVAGVLRTGEFAGDEDALSRLAVITTLPSASCDAVTTLDETSLARATLVTAQVDGATTCETAVTNHRAMTLDSLTASASASGTSSVRRSAASIVEGISELTCVAGCVRSAIGSASAHGELLAALTRGIVVHTDAVAATSAHAVVLTLTRSIVSGVSAAMSAEQSSLGITRYSVGTCEAVSSVDGNVETGLVMTAVVDATSSVSLTGMRRTLLASLATSLLAAASLACELTGDVAISGSSSIFSTGTRARGIRGQASSTSTSTSSLARYTRLGAANCDAAASGRFAMLSSPNAYEPVERYAARVSARRATRDEPRLAKLRMRRRYG